MSTAIPGGKGTGEQSEKFEGDGASFMSVELFLALLQRCNGFIVV